MLAKPHRRRPELMLAKPTLYGNLPDDIRLSLPVTST